MLKLLKIVDKVEKPVMINEAVSLNISANGDCPDDITSILGKLVNLSNPTPVTDKMMPQGDFRDTMMKTISNVGDYADEAGHDYADEFGEEWVNAPAPDVADTAYMTKDLAGGLNKPKKQFKKEYPGDNPMAVAEARASQLMIEYKKILEATDSKDKPKSKVVHCSQCGKGFSGGGLKAPHHTGFSHCKDHKGMKVISEATDPRDSRPQTYRPNDTTPYSRDRLATRMPSNPKDSKPKKAGRLLGLKSSIKDALGKHGPKGHLPEEQVNELSPKTLGSYVNKSAASLGKAGYKAGSTDGTAAKLDPHIHTINKRSTGIKRATDRLTRESMSRREAGAHWDANKTAEKKSDTMADYKNKTAYQKSALDSKKKEKMKAYRADRDKNGED